MESVFSQAWTAIESRFPHILDAQDYEISYKLLNPERAVKGWEAGLFVRVKVSIQVFEEIFCAWEVFPVELQFAP